MKKFILGIVAIVTLFSLVGCKKNENAPIENNQKVEEDNTQANSEQNDAESIKNLLIAGGQWVPQTAYDVLEKKEVSLSNVYGSGIKYGGGINFFEDGRFEKFIGIDGENQDMFNLGTYSIDISNNQIIYTFNAGNVSNGKYEYENGEITSITIEEIFGDDDTIYSDDIVTLVKKSPERLAREKIDSSLIENDWKPVSATKNGQIISLEDVYGKDYNKDLKIDFYGGGDMNKDIVVENSNLSEYGFYFFDEEKISFQFIVNGNVDDRIDIPCKYELQDGEVVSFTFIENYGTDNEIEVRFEK